MRTAFNAILRRLIFGAVSVAGLAAHPSIVGRSYAAERHQPTVVELFTSQGCSSCPPANANAAALSERTDLLVLSFGVTYWDYLGWKDIFARPEFTERQRIYEPALGNQGPFTPQIVVNGSHDVVGNRRAEIEALIAASTTTDVPRIDIDGKTVMIGSGSEPSRPADIWLVHYDPRRIDVPVQRGENGGRTLPHKNVVRELAHLGMWNGGALSVDLPASPPELRTAILVQLPEGGPILAAATN